MEIVAFVFGIFGCLAFLQIPSLKRKVENIEDQLSKLSGTSYHEGRTALGKIARDNLGKRIVLELAEGHEDVDIVMYGNTKHGSNTILDADDEWMLVHIDTPKGSKDKLIRLGSVERISLLE